MDHDLFKLAQERDAILDAPGPLLGRFPLGVAVAHHVADRFRPGTVGPAHMIPGPRNSLESLWQLVDVDSDAPELMVHVERLPSNPTPHQGGRIVGESPICTGEMAVPIAL